MIRSIAAWRLRRAGYSRILADWLTRNHETGDKAVQIVCAACIFVFSAQTIDSILAQKQRADRREAELIRMERIVASCLNHKPIAVDGVAHEGKAQSLGVRL